MINKAVGLINKSYDFWKASRYDKRSKDTKDTAPNGLLLGVFGEPGTGKSSALDSLLGSIHSSTFPAIDFNLINLARVAVSYSPTSITPPVAGLDDSPELAEPMFALRVLFSNYCSPRTSDWTRLCVWIKKNYPELKDLKLKDAHNQISLPHLFLAIDDLFLDPSRAAASRRVLASIEGLFNEESDTFVVAILSGGVAFQSKQPIHWIECKRTWEVAVAGGDAGGRTKRPREEKESGTDVSTHVKKPRKTRTTVAEKTPKTVSACDEKSSTDPTKLYATRFRAITHNNCTYLLSLTQSSSKKRKRVAMIVSMVMESSSETASASSIIESTASLEAIVAPLFDAICANWQVAKLIIKRGGNTNHK